MLGDPNWMIDGGSKLKFCQFVVVGNIFLATISAIFSMISEEPEPSWIVDVDGPASAPAPVWCGSDDSDEELSERD